MTSLNSIGPHEFAKKLRSHRNKIKPLFNLWASMALF